MYGVKTMWKSEDGTPVHNEHISLFVMTYMSHARQCRPLLMAEMDMLKSTYLTPCS